MGVILRRMIPVKLVPLSMKDGTGSVQSFDHACPTSVIERLILFWLSDHNFWIQWCSIDTDILYLSELHARKLFMNFVQSL